MSDNTGCINGCTRTNQDGNREPTQARNGRLCNGCYDRLEKWLREIPERYALVPQFLTQASTIDENPGSKKRAKRPVAPTPVRVGALDLLDTRLGRKWQGTEPTEDRRGALGSLLAIANEIRSLRGSPNKPDSHVLTEADYIRLSLELLAHQEWVNDAYKEIKHLHRDLGDAIGVYPPKPVGKCPNTPEGQTDECAGPLLPDHSGVICPRCGRHWDHNQLGLLGRNLKATA